MKGKVTNIIGRSLLVMILSLAMLNVALAQDHKVEVSGSLGYTLASGFDVDPITLAGKTVTRIGMNSGFTYNFQGDFLIGENAGIGFMFARQDSKLTAKVAGSGDVDIADMPVYNYQFPFTYNFLASDAKIRPYLLFGLGWTQYSPGKTQLGAGTGGKVGTTDLSGKSKFAGTLGGGVKVFLKPNMGIKGQARWTPTYLTSQTEGVWCNYYYCSAYADLKYANQGEFTGGLFVRF